MKKLTVRKLNDGSLAGHHGVFDGDDSVGCLNADEFRDYVKQRLAEVPVEMFTFMLSPPGISLSSIAPHLELFANKVMPHFRDA